MLSCRSTHPPVGYDIVCLSFINLTMILNITYIEFRHLNSFVLKMLCVDFFLYQVVP